MKLAKKWPEILVKWPTPRFVLFVSKQSLNMFVQTDRTSHGLIREIPQKLMVAIKVFASVIINSGLHSAKV